MDAQKAREEARLLNETKEMMMRFEEMGMLPTFGISAGRLAEPRSRCTKKMQQWCDGWCSRDGSHPPEGLLTPGRLQARPDLDQLSQCFLWYTNALFSRATGGQAGKMIPRLGPGVDNKGYFVEAMRKYENRHGCAPYQMYPPTLELNESRTCFDFFFDNSKWAASRDSLWFMKSARGSTGRHISLLRRHEIEAIAAKREDGCPREGSVASLEVENIWTIDNKKFDNRVYVLVPSLDPFMIFFREGHLRFSVLNYSEPVPAQPPTRKLQTRPRDGDMYRVDKDSRAGGRHRGMAHRPENRRSLLAAGDVLTTRRTATRHGHYLRKSLGIDVADLRVSAGHRGIHGDHDHMEEKESVLEFRGEHENEQRTAGRRRLSVKNDEEFHEDEKLDPEQDPALAQHVTNPRHTILMRLDHECVYGTYCRLLREGAMVHVRVRVLGFEMTCTHSTSDVAYEDILSHGVTVYV
jgi:hypothetical protein